MIGIALWTIICIVAFVVGYCVAGPLSAGKPPFSPPDGSPATFKPWQPWKPVR